MFCFRISFRLRRSRHRASVTCLSSFNKPQFTHTLHLWKKLHMPEIINVTSQTFWGTWLQFRSCLLTQIHYLSGQVFQLPAHIWLVCFENQFQKGRQTNEYMNISPDKKLCKVQGYFITLKKLLLSLPGETGLTGFLCACCLLSALRRHLTLLITLKLSRYVLNVVQDSCPLHWPSVLGCAHCMPTWGLQSGSFVLFICYSCFFTRCEVHDRFKYCC